MISCQIYDYIEIACMYQLKVRLTLKNGDTIDGVALDTVRNGDREECMLLNTSDSQQQVVLDGVKSMQALVKNPHFDTVDIA